MNRKKERRLEGERSLFWTMMMKMRSRAKETTRRVLIE